MLASPEIKLLRLYQKLWNLQIAVNSLKSTEITTHECQWEWFSTICKISFNINELETDNLCIRTWHWLRFTGTKVSLTGWHFVGGAYFLPTTTCTVKARFAADQTCNAHIISDVLMTPTERPFHYSRTRLKAIPKNSNN